MGEEGDSLLPTTARTLAKKKGYIKKQNKKNSPKVTVCVIPPPTPTAGCFCEHSRVWYNWTEESWKALWNYMCAASPTPPPVPQIIITLPNKQKDGLVPFSWFGFRVPVIVWIGSLSDLKNMAIVCVISNTCAYLLWKSTLCCMHYTNKPGVDTHTKNYQQL